MATRFEGQYWKRFDDGKYVCVGLDPDVNQLPPGLGPMISPAVDVMTFITGIIDVTHSVTAAYKLQSAYYEALGGDGIKTLEYVCDYIRATDSGIPIILDYKRGDIGRTSEAYVEAAFDNLDVDAVTVNPYMGMEAMRPFLERTDRHVFVLCRTSNPGAGEFQNLFCYPFVDMDTGHCYSTRTEAKREGSKGNLEQTTMTQLYEFVARRVARNWNVAGNCGVVVGATVPDELGIVRRIVGGDMLILVPGVGKQGGDLGHVLRRGSGYRWPAVVINNSSGVLFAYKTLKKPDGIGYSPAEWELAAYAAAKKMNDDIAELLYPTLAD